jgi:hypothetical protein
VLIGHSLQTHLADNVRASNTHWLSGSFHQFEAQGTAQISRSKLGHSQRNENFAWQNSKSEMTIEGEHMKFLKSS